MSTKFNKDSLLARINAEKVLSTSFREVEGFTTNKLNNMPSLNNADNSIDFVIDILEILRGARQIVDEITRILTYELPAIEKSIRSLIVKTLNENYICELDPNIPEEYFEGIDIELKKFDFFRLLRVDPNSDAGRLLFNDASNDLNAFLQNVIQSPDEEDWKGIIHFKYHRTKGGVNKVMTIRLNEKFSVDGNGTGKVTPFLTEFIDNITLFTTNLVIPNLYDNLFGVVSKAINKSKNLLTVEEQINQVIQNVINRDAIEEVIIDDTFFEFSNEQLKEISEAANNRGRGIRILKDCAFVESSIEFDTLSSLTTALINEISGGTLTGQKRAVDNIVETLSIESTDNLAPNDKNDGSISIIKKIYTDLVKVIFKFLVLPKAVLIFLIIGNIFTTSALVANDAFTFLKQNKQIFYNFISEIIEKIVNYLLKIVIKYLKELVVENLKRRLIEKQKNETAILFSLLGISALGDIISTPQIDL
jgi:hypothetical protein